MLLIHNLGSDCVLIWMLEVFSITFQLWMCWNFNVPQIAGFWNNYSVLSPAAYHLSFGGLTQYTYSLTLSQGLVINPHNIFQAATLLSSVMSDIQPLEQSEILIPLSAKWHCYYFGALLLLCGRKISAHRNLWQSWGNHGVHLLYSCFSRITVLCCLLCNAWKHLPDALCPIL